METKKTTTKKRVASKAAPKRTTAKKPAAKKKVMDPKELKEAIDLRTGEPKRSPGRPAAKQVSVRSVVMDIKKVGLDVQHLIKAGQIHPIRGNGVLKSIGRISKVLEKLL